MKIFFLDFDGVISTNRAWIANKHIDDFYDRWIDPLAVGMIAELCGDYGYTIVVTSTWRKFGYDNCKRALGPCAAYLHDDWRTKDLWFSGDSKGTRPAEIDDWIARNGCDDYLILDDDGFDWTDHQRERWIKTQQLNGFSTEDYEQVMNVNLPSRD